MQSSRFRFGLRSLFVLIVIVAIPSAWAGYALNWIRQRRAMLTEEGVTSIWQTEPPRAPGALWIFGEVGVGGITVLDPGDDYQEKHERAKRLFPEAKVYSW